MRMTESISYEQKTRTHSKNGLEFLSTNDASSILRNWIFCPEITYRSYQSQISFENFRAFFLAGSVAVKVVPAIILNFLQFGSKLGFRLTRLRWFEKSNQVNSRAPNSQCLSVSVSLVRIERFRLGKIFIYFKIVWNTIEVFVTNARKMVCVMDKQLMTVNSWNWLSLKQLWTIGWRNWTTSLQQYMIF